MEYLEDNLDDWLGEELEVCCLLSFLADLKAMDAIAHSLLTSSLGQC